jgi:outer membrane protein OmpA-like peptidoglycan-associated protein
VNYLVSKGIEKSRLTAKGYGESRLVNGCADNVPCSEEEHQANRRTEFTILDK